MTASLAWKRLTESYETGVGGPHGFTYRAEVPGGWLVATWAGTAKRHGYGGGLTFVPDPDHEWTVREPVTTPKARAPKPRRPVTERDKSANRLAGGGR
jgi:hypothetical protein